MKNESCEPPRNIDWEDAQFVEVALGAEYGIPEAQRELQRREKQVDTVSGKASAPSPIIEWIEE